MDTTQDIRIIDRLRTLVREHYIFSDKGNDIADRLEPAGLPSATADAAAASIMRSSSCASAAAHSLRKSFTAARLSEKRWRVLMRATTSERWRRLGFADGLC